MSIIATGFPSGPFYSTDSYNITVTWDVDNSSKTQTRLSLERSVNNGAWEVLWSKYFGLGAESSDSELVGSGSFAAGDRVHYKVVVSTSWNYTGWKVTGTTVKLYTVTPVPDVVVTDNTASGYHSQLPTLSWAAADNAVTYKLSYAEGSEADETAEVTGITTNSYTFTTNRTKGAVLHWKIQAVNDNGSSDWSADFTTNIADDPVAATIDDTDDYIDDAETDVSRTPTIAWEDGGSDATAATEYDVYFSIETDPTQIVSEGQTALTYTPSINLIYGQTYYWKIVSRNLAGEVESSVYSFTVAGLAAGTPENKTYQRRLCAVAGNRFYYEDSSSPMRKLILLKGLELDTSKQVNMFAAYQKVFIVNDDQGRFVVDFSNIKLELGSTPGTDPAHGDSVVGAGGAEMIVDYWDGDKVLYGRKVTSTDFVDGEALTLNGVGWGINTDASDCQTDPTVPHYYDWKEFGGTDTNMPDYPTIGVLYRGRASLAGDSVDPHIWYKSRQANPFDYEYAADDYQSPVAGNGTQAGKTGDVITAMIPYLDDYEIIGCTQSLWILHGDPAANGTLDMLSDSANCFGKSSWAWDDQGRLYIVGTNAIYRISNAGRTVENITFARIPTIVSELEINPAEFIVTAGIDKRRSGILFSFTNLSDGSNTSYWYDFRTDGFFPETYNASCGVFSQHYYEADEPEHRRLVLGCHDGCLRVFDQTQKSDQAGTVLAANEVAIDSYVLMGPKQITSDRDRKYILNQLTIIAAGGGSGGSETDTDSITIGVIGQTTAEGVIEALNASSLFTSLTKTGPGRSIRHRVRCSAVFVGIKLSNSTAGESWAVEEVLAEARPGGRVR